MKNVSLLGRYQRTKFFRELRNKHGKGTCYALAYQAFRELSDTRKRYAENVSKALEQYGDHGALVAGVIRDHFPHEVKEVLRHDAHKITELIDESRALWLASGKRHNTWLEAYRKQETHGSRY